LKFLKSCYFSGPHGPKKTLDFSRPKITGKTRILQKGSISIEIPWEMMHFCKTLDFTQFFGKSAGKFPGRNGGLFNENQKTLLKMTS
jgi:hypothetical protein